MTDETFKPCRFCQTTDECTAAAKCVETAKRSPTDIIVRQARPEDVPPLTEIDQLSNWCECTICTDGD